MHIVDQGMAFILPHSQISIAFEVGGVRKDYDEYEMPASWNRNFDTSNWTLLAAFDGRERIGGAVIAFDTPATNRSCMSMPNAGIRPDEGHDDAYGCPKVDLVVIVAPAEAGACVVLEMD